MYCCYKYAVTNTHTHADTCTACTRTNTVAFCGCQMGLVMAPPPKQTVTFSAFYKKQKFRSNNLLIVTSLYFFALLPLHFLLHSKREKGKVRARARAVEFVAIADVWQRSSNYCRAANLRKTLTKRQL